VLQLPVPGVGEELVQLLDRGVLDAQQVAVG
jgi:hypothetical protein